MRNFMEYVHSTTNAKPITIKPIDIKLEKSGKAKPMSRIRKAPAGTPLEKKYTKQKISAALREQVWIQSRGQVFKSKCAVNWCQNIITVFDFQCGHDIPESKGGPTDITNLYPICGKCNLSMGNHYTFKEWCLLYKGKAQEEPLPVPAPPLLLKRPNKRSWIDFFFCLKKQKNPVSTGETDGV